MPASIPAGVPSGAGATVAEQQAVPVAAQDFERMWADLLPVGRVASGGYVRHPWASAEAELLAWFGEQCAARGLTLSTDPFGNAVAWWDAGSGPGVLTGSHLDSVVDGGAYDGPLGVVSALAAVDRLRERGFVPVRPIGVAVFAAEEGSRFGLACLGSRLATGATSWADARELRDPDGTFLGDLVEGGRSPLLDGVGTYVELHVEQGRALVDLDASVGVASGIWPHGRWRFAFEGRGDHAGSTRMEDRADPMLTYAAAALAADERARLAGQRATFGRVAVTPNGTNAIASSVTGWLDARASSAAGLTELVEAIAAAAAGRADRDGTSVEVAAESLSGEVVFDGALGERLAGVVAREETVAPLLPTQAGHDAGILQGAGVPTAMLFVRNPTGVSHSPEEHAPMADCLAGVDALADALEELAR